MANRLEREFPRTCWRVIAPVGPRGEERDIIRRCVARGRGWRRRAVRKPEQFPMRWARHVSRHCLAHREKLLCFRQ
jgi:hypothetical protein